ncbi:MAG: CARDB domain-containing protein, partial [Thermoplasmata archaeon]
LQPGEKTVTLLARDNKGGSATATVTIVIKDKPKAEISLLGIDSIGEKKVNSENVISVRVSNGASYDSAPFALRMSVNGETYEDKQITLRKNESAKIDFYWSAEKDGEYMIIVEVMPSSDITIKNGRVQIKIIISPEAKDLTFLWLLVIIILLGIVIAGVIIVKRRAERERETLYGPFVTQPQGLHTNNVPLKEDLNQKEQREDSVQFVQSSGYEKSAASIFADMNSDINRNEGLASTQNADINVEKPPVILKPKSVPTSTKYRAKMPANYSKEGPSALREDIQASPSRVVTPSPMENVVSTFDSKSEIENKEKVEKLPERQDNFQMIKPSELGLEERSKQSAPTNIKPVEGAVCASCGEEIFDGGKLCPKCEVTDLMLSAERLIAGAKGTGIENKHADELVERARTAFKMAKFEEVKSIISELTAITKDTRELSDQLQKYQIKLNELDSKGKDTKELKSQLLLIKSFIQSGNFEKARIYFEKFETSLREFEKKESMQQIKEYENRCKVCGMKIMSSWDRCPYCNTNVKAISEQPTIKNPQTQTVANYVVCSKCGNELQVDWDICPFCSSPIIKQ